jgi:hypothetical protein
MPREGPCRGVDTAAFPHLLQDEGDQLQGQFTQRRFIKSALGFSRHGA